MAAIEIGGPPARAADVGVRTPSRLVAPDRFTAGRGAGAPRCGGAWGWGPRRGGGAASESTHDVPGAGRTTAGVCRRSRLHARRVPARGRAPIRRVMGLPGVGLLRPYGPVRFARRLPLSR